MPRLREFNVPLGFYDTGADNAITDVKGVRVGHCTVRGEVDEDGRSDINTGVTCIWPHEGWPWQETVLAGADVANGHGDLIGINQIREWGTLRSPILLSSSLYIGAVYDATAQWAKDVDPAQGRANFFMPIVGEVSDGVLCDSRQFPITRAHVEEALESASAEPPAEGAVGAGTGTLCYDFKGGIGSASRVVPDSGGDWTVGALVLTNYGARRNLTIGGVQVGPLLDVPIPPLPISIEGSCIVVVATDAPLTPNQLRRIAKRGSLGLNRSGAFAGHSSGEFTVAFSTANRSKFPEAGSTASIQVVRDGPNEAFQELFEATVEAVNEAVLNSLSEAETTVGFNGAVGHALPVEEVVEILTARGAIP